MKKPGQLVAQIIVLIRHDTTYDGCIAFEIIAFEKMSFGV